MPALNLQQSTVQELLRLYADVLDALRERGVMRTRNNPVADYAEWLVSRRLVLSLASSSRAGYDARASDGTRYQIKSRRLDPPNASRQLSVIRNLHTAEFDYLVGVLFDRDFSVREAYVIPHSIIGDHASFSQHVNGHRLTLRGDVLEDPQVQDITSLLGDVDETAA